LFTIKHKIMAKPVKEKQVKQLALIRPHCAAIDVGSMLMMVAYSDAEGNQHLLESGAYTTELEQLTVTLKQAGVKEVAMEATGVYWMVIYELLEQHDFKVTLVNARHFKNTEAQKTDVKDCEWLHQLHAHGLLRSSHIAGEAFRELRSYIHERNLLQQNKSDTLNRIHKLLTQMNIKVQHLISDIEGVAGMKLLRAIADGIKDPEALMLLIKDSKLKADEASLHQSLNGLYKEQYITILNQTLKAYDFFMAQMKAYETLIEQVLQKMLPGQQEAATPKKGLVRKNQYSINLKEYLQRIVGVDLTRVDGLNEISILEIIAVTGLDMNKWPTAEHFASWLKLSPSPKISGGKVIGYERKPTRNKATQMFRLAAQAMWQNKGALGYLYRKLAAIKGAKKAIKAVARKIALIFYNMIKHQTEFNSDRLQIDTRRQTAKKISILQKEAAKYGYVLQSLNA